MPSGFAHSNPPLGFGPTSMTLRSREFKNETQNQVIA